MVFNKQYWLSVLKRIIYVFIILIGIFLAFKLAMFYMPFLVAFIIAVIIEPLIKKIMDKTKLTRRTSALIIFTLVALIIFGAFAWGIVTIFSEASTMLQGINDYFNKAYDLFNNFSSYFNLNNIEISNEIQSIIQSSSNTVFDTLNSWTTDFLNNLINTITGIPIITIYIGISIVALYFISVDRIYIIDQVEHHLPGEWVKKIGIHFRELVATIGGYLKAQATLILVSFIISLIRFIYFKTCRI